MTKYVHVLFVISQAYSRSSRQAVFPNISCSLQLLAETKKNLPFQNIRTAHFACFYISVKGAYLNEMQNRKREVSLEGRIFLEVFCITYE